MSNNVVTTPQAVLRSFSVMGFDIVSSSDMEIEETYSLIKGASLKVMNSTGEVIHEGIRGFMPINQTYHLIRLQDGGWWYCTVDGKPKMKTALREKNLHLGNLAVMFDERGKLRLAQQNARYDMLSL